MAPLIVIVGPTASGKSGLAMSLAHKFKGQIICADSRTVYKGMDIGTAKPSKEDQINIKHHCLDLVHPDQQYSAAQFKADATAALQTIRVAGDVPFIVGGSGLYIDGLIYDFEFHEADKTKRDILSNLSIEKLQSKAVKFGLDPAHDTYRNKRHLIGYIERKGNTVGKQRLPETTLIIGLSVQKEILDVRIEQRADAMIKAGLEREVQDLLTTYSPEDPGMHAPGYDIFAEYLAGGVSIDEARKQFARSHVQLAKRQMTWFKRNADINWVDHPQQAEQLIADFLNKFATIDT